MPSMPFSSASPEAIRERDARYPWKGTNGRIVQHATDGAIGGTLRWFAMGKEERARANLRNKNPTAAQLSAAMAKVVVTAAHYVIGRDGTIYQSVPDIKKCLHAGSTLESGWNDRSIGIEHEVRLTPWPKSSKPPAFPLADWTDAMLASSARVVGILCKTYDIPVDRLHIIGHSEVPHRPGDAFHTDPGAAFPWARFMEMI